MLRTDANGERYLSLASISPVSGTPMRPLLMTNKALLDGPNAVGLLIRLSGKPLYIDQTPPYPRYLYIDDGSGASLETQPGIRVILNGLNSPITLDLNREQLLVTGVLTLNQGEHGVIPVLRPRANGDILAFGGAP